VQPHLNEDFFHPPNTGERQRNAAKATPLSVYSTNSTGGEVPPDVVSAHGHAYTPEGGRQIAAGRPIWV